VRTPACQRLSDACAGVCTRGRGRVCVCGEWTNAMICPREVTAKGWFSGGLVSLGTRCLSKGPCGRQAHFLVRGLLHMPLVPRDGARVL
jgi:hypothetical protein